MKKRSIVILIFILALSFGTVAFATDDEVYNNYISIDGYSYSTIATDSYTSNPPSQAKNVCTYSGWGYTYKNARFGCRNQSNSNVISDFGWQGGGTTAYYDYTITMPSSMTVELRARGNTALTVGHRVAGIFYAKK